MYGILWNLSGLDGYSEDPSHYYFLSLGRFNQDIVEFRIENRKMVKHLGRKRKNSEN